jgi:hypothetical protein
LKHKTIIKDTLLQNEIINEVTKEKRTIIKGYKLNSEEIKHNNKIRKNNEMPLKNDMVMKNITKCMQNK